jgi:hypothetical protein
MKENVMRSVTLLFAAVVLVISATANATTIQLTSPPFTSAAGIAALATPGRTVVGGELFTDFNIATDVFLIDPFVFGVQGNESFANGLAANLSPTGLNVIVLQNTAPGFAAGAAADLIAAQVTTPGPGFFVYFNVGLGLPRLVFSPDLNDNTVDLQVLARLTNLTGADGFAAMPTFTEANFQFGAAPEVPEPATLLLVGSGAALAVRGRLRRRRR